MLHDSGVLTDREAEFRLGAGNYDSVGQTADRNMSIRLGRYTVHESGGERQPHVLVVTYLFPPCNAIAVRRPIALVRSYRSLGVRTTVLTSAISGAFPDDASRGILRTGDLRTRFETQYQALVGYAAAAVPVRKKPRWWTRAIVPDVTAISWLPAALPRLRSLLREDRPDGVLTTSPPEASHLLGLVAQRKGVPWMADFRDGWRFDPSHPRPWFGAIDKSLERRVATSADAVTAVNEPIAADLRRRVGAHVVHVSNGFDSAAVAAATDEHETLSSRRFSIVYTGTLGLDAPEQHDPHGSGARAFVAALQRLAAHGSNLPVGFEVVVAGVVSESERELLTSGSLREVVRVLGPLSHERALGLQRAADGLLLLAGTGEATTAKVFEYLSAEKPIFALARADGPAARLLVRAGDHLITSPTDETQIEQDLVHFIETWAENGTYRPNPSFVLEEYDFDRLAERMLDLFVEIGAFSRSDQ